MNQQDLKDELIHLATMIAEANARRHSARRAAPDTSIWPPSGTDSTDLREASDRILRVRNLLNKLESGDSEDVRRLVDLLQTELSQADFQVRSGIDAFEKLLQQYKNALSALADVNESVLELAEITKSHPLTRRLLHQEASYALKGVLLGASESEWARSIRSLLASKPMAALNLATDPDCPDFPERRELMREAALKGIETAPGTLLAWLLDVPAIRAWAPAGLGLDEAACRRLLAAATREAPLVAARVIRERFTWWPKPTKEEAVAIFKALLRLPPSQVALDAASDASLMWLISADDIDAEDWTLFYRLHAAHKRDSLRHFLETYPPPTGTRLSAEDVRAALVIPGSSQDDRLYFITRLVPLADGQSIDVDLDLQSIVESGPSRRL